MTKKRYTPEDFVNRRHDPAPKNSIHPELIGATAALNSFAGNSSASRAQMAHTQISQAVTLLKPTPRIVQTGVEMEFAKYAYSIKMPCDGLILEIIKSVERPEGEMQDYVVIYQDTETKELGCLNLISHYSYQGYFGYSYRAGKDIQLLRVHGHVPKGAILREVNSVNDHGDFMFGREVNVAFMSHPGTADDAFVVSESFLKNMQYQTVERIMVSWGVGNFPLNLYGNESNYKIFPDIGENVRDDGLLMALRPVDKESPLNGGVEFDPLSPIARTQAACSTVYHATDKRWYVGASDTKVTAIEIYHDGRDKTYTSQDDQPLRYYRKSVNFAERIKQVYMTYRSRLGDQLKMSGALHKLVTDSLAALSPERGAERLSRVVKQVPIGRWTAWFTVVRTHTPGMGSKYTCTYAGKGVVSLILPDRMMPVDADGRRAEVLIDPGSTYDRTIPSRLYEHYLTGTAYKLDRMIETMTGLPKGTQKSMAYRLLQSKPELVQTIFEHWVKWHTIINPQIGQWVSEGKVGRDQLDHVCHLIEYGCMIYRPVDCQKEITAVVPEMERSAYRPTYGPVSFEDESGRVVTTRDAVRISSVYFTELNKPGTDGNAANFTRMAPQGVPAVPTGGDSYATASRVVPTRGVGEAEMRIAASYGDMHNPYALVAELINRHTNPSVLAHQADRLLGVDHPGRLDSLVDRETVPYGSGRVTKIIEHVFECSGVKFTCEPNDRKTE